MPRQWLSATLDVRRRGQERRRRGATARTVCRPVIAACAAITIGGCEKKQDANAYAPPPPPEVIVAKPVEREVTSYLTYTGTITASEAVDLRARVQGFLEKIAFQPGQRVKKGEVLFEIDKQQYQAAVAQARARVKSAEATLLGAESDARLARELADQRAGPEIDAVIKAAKRDVAAADIDKAKAELTEALLNLGYCTVTAPIDGRISKNLVDVGNLVGRGEPTLLASIVQATPSFVSVDVNEADVLAVRREREKTPGASKIEPGRLPSGEWRPCELSLADREDFGITGRIDYVEPQLDKQTGTLEVRTRFENTDETLVPGLFAAVRFAMSSRKAMLVPEAALLSDQQGRYAMVVDEESKVQAKRVEIGPLEGSMRVVEKGLAPDDRVIVLGVLKARPGSKVTPKRQEPPAAASDR